MDWNRVEGNWKQVKGKVKEKWGKLTEDDLTAINGRREQLEGKIQERYGYAKNQARREIEDWYRSTESHLADEIDNIRTKFPGRKLPLTHKGVPTTALPSFVTA